jgi:hypothetical protein
MTHTIYGRSFILSGSVAVHSEHSDWSRGLSAWAMGRTTLLGIESYRVWRDSHVTDIVTVTVTSHLLECDK